MNRNLKLLQLAIVALFAFCTPAEAQFGNLINKAKKAVEKEAKQNDSKGNYTATQNGKVSQQSQKEEYIIAPQKGYGTMDIYFFTKKKGTYDAENLEIVLDQEYTKGDLVGQKVIFKINPTTGKITSNDGKDWGQISADGTITGRAGTIKVEYPLLEVVKNGETIGSVTARDALCDGTKVGFFNGYGNPYVVAWFYFCLWMDDDMLAQVRKDTKAKAEKLEKQRQANKNDPKYMSWSTGGVWFKGKQPEKTLFMGSGVKVYYNGTFGLKSHDGGTDVYEGTGDICVLYPKDYHGTPMRFISTGGTVQIEYDK